MDKLEIIKAWLPNIKIVLEITKKEDKNKSLIKQNDNKYGTIEQEDMKRT